MALLLKDRDAASEAATPPPHGGPSGSAPDFACETCGAGMVRGQDWCLECGTAAKGRLGARAGWRAAFTVVGLTLLLVTGAVLASYAALTSDAERTASAPTAGDGAPIVAQAQPGVTDPSATTIQPGPTGPGTTPPPAVLPGAGPPTAAQPVIPTTRPFKAPPAVAAPPQVAGSPGTPSTGTATPATQLPPNATGSTGSTGSTPTTGPGSTGTQQTASANVAPQLINFAKGAATTYDPSKRPGAEFGPAANAIDGKANTVWDVVTPADGKPLGVGVIVDLKTAMTLQSLRITTPTPGFTVELYGAVDGKEVPVDVLDKRWQHLTDRKAVEDGEPIALKGKGEAGKYQLLLVYVTAPADTSDPRVAIGELVLRGAP